MRLDDLGTSMTLESNKSLLDMECRNPGEILSIPRHEGRLPIEGNGSNPEIQRATTYSLSAQVLKNRLRLLIKVHNRDGTKVDTHGLTPVALGN